VKELQIAAVVRNEAAAVQELFQKHVVPTYSRFDLVFSHGQGSYLFDVRGKRYLDMGAGIAVCVLGHAHPELADALAEQARKLVHVSNRTITRGRGVWPPTWPAGWERANVSSAIAAPKLTKACSSWRGASATKKAGSKS
jgi:hypothetical protein